MEEEMKDFLREEGRELDSGVRLERFSAAVIHAAWIDAYLGEEDVYWGPFYDWMGELQRLGAIELGEVLLSKSREGRIWFEYDKLCAGAT